MLMRRSIVIPVVASLAMVLACHSNPAPEPAADAGHGSSSDASFSDASFSDASLSDGGFFPADGGTPDGTPGSADAGGTEAELLLQGGAGEQIIPHVAAREDGTTWLAWYSEASPNEYSIRLQRMDTAGAKRLGADGVQASAVDSDSWVMDYSLLAAGNGDAVLAYSNTSDFIVRVQRFDAQGAPLWGAGGKSLTTSAVRSYAPSAAMCEDGTVAMAWQFESDSADGVALQRVDASGAGAWLTPKTISASSGKSAMQSPQIVPSEDADFIMVWTENSGIDTLEDAFVQRFNAQGNPVWSANVKLNGADQLPFMASPLIASDGAGGVYATWFSVQSNQMFMGYVQHIAKDGSASWPQGLPVSTSTAMSHLPSAIGSMHEKVFVAWMETDPEQNTSGLYAQAFDDQGHATFGASGLALVEADGALLASAAAARATGTGAALFYSFGAGSLMNGRAGVASIPFASSPSVDEVVLSNVVSGKSSPDVSGQIGGGYWLVWTDDRSGDSDIWGRWWRAP